MKRFFLLIGLLLSIGAQASAAMTADGVSDAESLCGRNEKAAIADSRDILSPEIMKYEAAAVRSGEVDFASYHAVLTEAGTLESVFGDRLLVTDSLSVEGPVGEEDFSTMWKATFYGRLRAIDLRPATVVGGRIPGNAFFHYDEQMSKKDSRHCPLRSIYFPEGVTEIGEGALSMCYDLTSVNFPSTLRLIDNYAFMICLSLSSETLDFKEGLEEIGDKAFYNCRGMGGEIEFPKSLRRIGSSAFHDCSFSEVTDFPGSLGVNGAEVESAADAAIYDLTGRRIAAPAPGQIYIQNGRKHIAPVR